jgi:tetratricopeptide (TPR) repeat protein
MGFGLLLAAILAMQAPDHAAEGMKALEARQYEAALGHFEKAIEADPKDYAAHFHYALAASMLERDAEAAAHYRKVLELKPGLYEAELNLGIVLVSQKQFAEAVTQVQAACEQKPKELRPAYYLAEALFGAGEFADAEQRYQAATAIDPKYAPAWVGLARAKARQGRLDEAAGDYRKASEADPEYREALLELADQYAAAREPKKAIEIYREFPNNVAARERMGELLAKEGELAAAIPPLEQAVAQSPTTANKVALAQAYLKTGEAAKGIKLLGEAVGAEPRDYDLRMLYGRSLRDQHAYPAAVREFVEATRLKPDAADAFSEVAVAAILMESYPLALQALDRVKALGAEKPGHIFFRAVVLDRTKQRKPALEAYQQFLSVSGGSSPNEEFKARQRVKVLQRELARR